MSNKVAELVTNAQKGDLLALSELVDLYQTPAIRVAQNILGNLADGEDAVQDAWIIATQRLETLRNPSRFGAWFYRIVTNVAIRKRQRQNAYQTHIENLEHVILSAGNTVDEEQEALYRIPLAMSMLSNKEQLTTTLHYFSGVPIAKIAQLLEIPEGTVKSRLHHARQTIRKEIEKMKNQMERVEHIPSDFRKVIAGMKGEIPWQKIFTGDFSGWSEDGKAIKPATSPKYWKIIDDGIVGEKWEGDTNLTFGDETWENVEFSFLVTPIAGGNAQAIFRRSEDADSRYFFDMMMGWQAIAINRVDLNEAGKPNLVKLSVVNYPLEHGREYAVCIAIRSHSITTYINGALVNQVTDASCPRGMVGLNVWYSKTLFRDIQVRILH